MADIGIDLGTTHSLIAVCENGEAKLIQNVHGDYLTPSIVSVDSNGNFLIGASARERLISHASETVHAFKRMAGTSKIWKLGKQTLRFEELSCLILKSLKADAENALNQQIDQAVISVPAYFNDTQRVATQNAAKLAGFTEVKLINEPTAASLVYGLKDQSDDRKYLVLDLGGGTFDVSILEYFNGILEVRASAGDNYLGGEDFTQVIADWITKQCNELKVKSPTPSRLYQMAESAKRSLSKADNTSIQIDEDTTLKLLSSMFESLATPLINRIRAPIVKAIQDAEIEPEELDDIVFIGGSTRMPIFHGFVTRLFKRFPRSSENPDHVVALGAAIQAGLLARSEGLEEVVMTDVMPYSMGIAVHNESELENPYFEPIIERNQTVPVSRVNRFYPVEKKQIEIRVDVFQGESRYTRNNINLGSAELHLSKNAEQRFIDVRFTYDTNGILEVLVEAGHGRTQQLIFEQTPGKLTPEEIQAALKKLEKIKVHPRDDEANRAILEKAERLYEQSIGERRDQVAEIIDYFNQLLATQDPKTIEQNRDKVKDALNAMEQEIWF
ncbi:Hsp70 family protein [Zooshikella marina]|uniref:Hsp70 family protein n=1 Tax=Zooshikella ganghwensis TaxID=202772 RepID=UPI001BAFF265|nr:Hsp70 family protein [Zooshikella ganghwensis]MBU2706030.1 Hsp70 family protein [Zooshikella ganghwensis]